MRDNDLKTEEDMSAFQEMLTVLNTTFWVTLREALSPIGRA